MTRTTNRRDIVVGAGPVRNGHPALARAHARQPDVATLADAAGHALAVVVGRRGRDGYPGTRVGSVVRGLPHRHHCPVNTVPAG
ncbi:hypothetical protein ACFUJR_07985 [Streptomyces sp. NPDC057271]|uniref:hypothetical protein n=1 Tax=unclassified Streptomyces TaxID=2593676 RepID=UPI003627E656